MGGRFLGRLMFAVFAALLLMKTIRLYSGFSCDVGSACEHVVRVAVV